MVCHTQGAFQLFHHAKKTLKQLSPPFRVHQGVPNVLDEYRGLDKKKHGLIPATNSPAPGSAEAGREEEMRKTLVNFFSGLSVSYVVLGSLLMLPGKAVAQVCSTCGQEWYVPGGPTVGARGICEQAFSGYAQCDAGERCTEKIEVTEKPDPANPSNKITEISKIRECSPYCKVEGLCGGAGGGGGTPARFVNLWDGDFWFCSAEYAAWECGT